MSARLHPAPASGTKCYAEITTGVTAFKAINLAELTGVAQQLCFATGKTLTMPSQTRLSATRTVRNW
ncbi:hypothetical protein ACIBL5_10100 [Streptomyces sp. NPDC050516]|uniref:hypothetical protein n=1 Tax=Streptomyces sp. NPDC050516 TaxID=3365621 RepID=UPI0037A2AF7D